MSQTLFRPLVFLAALRLASGGSGPLEAGGSPRAKPPLHVRLTGTPGMMVGRALLAVRERLGSDRCRAVLADFRARGGTPSLVQVLERLGRTPEQHLDTLTFKDGGGRGRCASSAILAFTSPGSDTIYVCPMQFKNAAWNNPAYAEMILIHEVLHTLGLGENPPTSLEITARVTERCGDAAARRRAHASP